MASADHTTFTLAQLSSVTRIKRRPAKFFTRRRDGHRTPKSPLKDPGVRRTVITGLMLCTCAFLLGLMVGTQLRP